MPQGPHSPTHRTRLRDLKGLRVHLVLPPSAETHALSAHLGRIGCALTHVWPIPETAPQAVDLVITTVEPEHRKQVQVFAASLGELGPPIIALAEYEDPSTLQQILDMGAVAVIERPVKPFGLLTNVMIAREVWRQRVENAQRVRDAEARHLRLSKLALARIVIAQRYSLSEEQAHKRLQKMSMDSRTSLEKVAERVIARDIDPDSPVHSCKPHH